MKPLKPSDTACGCLLTVLTQLITTRLAAVIAQTKKRTSENQVNAIPMLGTCQGQKHVQAKTKKHLVKARVLSRSEPRSFLDKVKAMSRPGMGYDGDHLCLDQVKAMLGPDQVKKRSLTRPRPGQNKSRLRPGQIKE